MKTQTEKEDEIRSIAQQFTSECIATIMPVTDGSINTTYEVVTESGERFILQGMSEIFDTAVLDNLMNVGPLLNKSGVTIPTCCPTTSGKFYVENAHRWYRALTFIPGSTIHDSVTPESAESAGALIGRFHSALVDADIVIQKPIPHFHDTDYYMDRLERIQVEYAESEKGDTLDALATEIRSRYDALGHVATALPTRIIHGDLKISNVRFDAAQNAIALIDMDTLMPGTIQIEMGDALRSWCGTAGEDSRDQVFDRDVYEAAFAGYVNTAQHISAEEIACIPSGIQLLTLELAARFVMDAYEETYFTLSSKYSSLYEQNKTRAENQLTFLKVFLKEKLV